MLRRCRPRNASASSSASPLRATCPVKCGSPLSLALRSRKIAGDALCEPLELATPRTRFDAESLAILCHRATRDVHAALAESLDQLII